MPVSNPVTFILGALLFVVGLMLLGAGLLVEDFKGRAAWLFLPGAICTSLGLALLAR